MFDVLARAMRHPFDYVGVVQTHTLFLHEHHIDGDDVHTFIFRMPKPFAWRAGQHAIFTLPGQAVRDKTWRPFSIASSPHEGFVQIGTRLPPEPSDFKKKLLRLHPDDPVRIFGPFGEFHTRGRRQHIVGIASGIGITPFRALAYDVTHGHTPDTRLTLIHRAVGTHPYQSVFAGWRNPKLQTNFVHTKAEVTRAITDAFDLHGNRAAYYISGSPSMLTETVAFCRSLGIMRVTTDPFKGY